MWFAARKDASKWAPIDMMQCTHKWVKLILGSGKWCEKCGELRTGGRVYKTKVSQALPRMFSRIRNLAQAALVLAVRPITMRQKLIDKINELKKLVSE